ncbi:hypothetical protein TSMEX_008894 [Taenia solium]|eukprot:TsM_000310900 transcript=TsM_000310900 gene=TsM_000310900
MTFAAKVVTVFLHSLLWKSMFSSVFGGRVSGVGKWKRAVEATAFFGTNDTLEPGICMGVPLPDSVSGKLGK